MKVQKNYSYIGVGIVFLVFLVILFIAVVKSVSNGIPKEVVKIFRSNGLGEIELINKNDVRFIIKADNVIYNGVMNKDKLVALYVGEGYGGNFIIYDIENKDFEITNQEKNIISRIKNFRDEYTNLMLNIPKRISDDIDKRVKNRNYFLEKAKVFDKGNLFILNVPVSYTSKRGNKITNIYKYEYNAVSDKIRLLEIL